MWPRDVDQLAGDEVIGADVRADREQCSRIVDAELGDLGLQRHLGLGEMLALRLGNVLLLCLAGAELDRDIAVGLIGAVRHDLAIFQRQHGHGNVTAVFLEQAGHAHFPGDHAGSHDQNS